MSTTTLSEAQLAANRANAQLSTGPRTEEGKSKSSLNAVKTGLTGRTVVLPTEDIAAYNTHVQSFFTGWNPQTDDERTLVQAIADTEWRLLRIPSLEAGLYALGRFEFVAEFASEDPDTRQSLIQVKTFQAYRRDFTNLSLQEARLRRQRERDAEKLTELQDQRRREYEADLNFALALFEEALREQGDEVAETALDTINHDHGFEFSLEEIESRSEELQSRRDGYTYRKFNRNPVSNAAGYRRAA